MRLISSSLLCSVFAIATLRVFSRPRTAGTHAEQVPPAEARRRCHGQRAIDAARPLGDRRSGAGGRSPVPSTRPASRYFAHPLRDTSADPARNAAEAGGSCAEGKAGRAGCNGLSIAPQGPMELLEAISSRSATRSYLPEPITTEAVRRLLEVAVQAPSAMNAQPWRFVVIQDTARLHRYSERAVS